MAIELTLPMTVAVIEPETPYSKLALQLALSTAETLPPVDGSLDASAHVVLKPYRILANGVADFAPQVQWITLSIGSLAQAAKGGDVALIAAIGAIQTAIQTYINQRRG